MTLLLDLEPLSCGQTDHLLDGLYKALSDPPDLDIWAPHHNPWIRDLIEDWTDRGLGRLTLIRDHLLRVANPERPPEPPFRKAEPWLRWDAAKMAEIQHSLDAKARADYTLDDWMTLVDLLIQTYLPDGVIQTEAEYLAVRAQLAGQIQANLTTLPSAAQLRADQIARIAALLPTTFADIPPGVLTERQVHILRFAEAQAGNLITNLTATLRGRVKNVLLDGVRRITLGDKKGTWQTLGQELFDTFADLNRDWRRIAITETGNATNTGFLASLKPGTHVRREEAYTGACPYCKSIRGQVLTVVSDDKEPKDWDAEVWPSKTNVGRSASPRKRVGGALVPREDHELWKIPAGLVHPHCRGAWSVVAGNPPGLSNEYQMWLRGLLVEAGQPTPV